MEYTSASNAGQDDRYAGRLSIALFESHWESIRAVCIQCHVRMHLARAECNRIRAAVRIQRAVREYLFSILQSKHVAATVIQSHVRRALAGRRRAELLRLKKKKEARLRIQANMRRIAEQRVREERAKQEAGRAIWSAYQSHRLRKEMKRRVARRALLRQNCRLGKIGRHFVREVLFSTPPKSFFDGPLKNERLSRNSVQFCSESETEVQQFA